MGHLIMAHYLIGCLVIHPTVLLHPMGYSTRRTMHGMSRTMVCPIAVLFLFPQGRVWDVLGEPPMMAHSMNTLPHRTNE